MPYRVEIAGAARDALDRVVELGAIDVDALPGGGLAALIPDGVPREDVARALGGRVAFSAATGRDAGSVWILRPRPVQIGRLRLVPDDSPEEAGAIRLIDGPAFGTGLHPTTALCLEALDDLCASDTPSAVLDVGTGSGVLALAALTLGVPRAVGIDIDEEALWVAAHNSRINATEHRLRLVRGGPEAIGGTWSLVLANVLAAPLIEMAPALVRRLGHLGLLVLSGIPSSVEQDVARAYVRQGLRHLRTLSREGWVALVMLASW